MSASRSRGVLVERGDAAVGEADRGRERDARHPDVDRRPHRPPQPFGDGERLGRAAHASNDGDELVATEPGEELPTPQPTRQTACCFAHGLVAGAVTERVVHQLETVEIDEAHAHHPVGVVAGQRHQPLVELPAVGQTRELVVERARPQLALHLHRVGHVVVAHHAAERGAEGTDDRPTADTDVAHLTFSHDADRLGDDGLAGAHTGDGMVDAVERIAIGIEQTQRVECEIVGRAGETVHLARRLVHQGHRAEPVGGHDAVVKLVEHGGEQAALVVELVGQLKVPVTAAHAQDDATDARIVGQVVPGHLDAHVLARTVPEAHDRAVHLATVGQPEERVERQRDVVGM